jgi:hypothetical protein
VLRNSEACFASARQVENIEQGQAAPPDLRERKSRLSLPAQKSRFSEQKLAVEK